MLVHCCRGIKIGIALAEQNLKLYCASPSGKETEGAISLIDTLLGNNNIISSSTNSIDDILASVGDILQAESRAALKNLSQNSDRESEELCIQRHRGNRGCDPDKHTGTRNLCLSVKRSERRNRGYHNPDRICAYESFQYRVG